MEALRNEILRALIVEAMALKNIETASRLALESSRGEIVKLSVSNGVDMEEFGGKKELKLADMAYRVSVQKFEAQAVYAFTKSGIG